jgi:hypothetical protein
MTTSLARPFTVVSDMDDVARVDESMEGERNRKGFAE